MDALARAARHRANKQGLTGNARSGHGDCATFLSKLEAVLEGVFYDMISSAGSEGKVSDASGTDIVVCPLAPRHVSAHVTLLMSPAEGTRRCSLQALCFPLPSFTVPC